MTKAETQAVHEPWPFRTCPRCDQRDFIAESHDGIVSFTCLECASAWRYSLGYLISVEAPSARRRVRCASESKST